MDNAPELPAPKPSIIRSPAFWVMPVLGAVVIFLDQITKIWIISRFDRPESGEAIILIPNFLQIIYRVNTGAAFSIFEEHPEYLRIFASIVALAVLAWGWRIRDDEKVLRWPLGLVFGGAVGNLIDRFMHGHVTDFIDAHWHERYHFPTFNVADSAICVGMGMLILLSLIAPNRQ